MHKRLVVLMVILALLVAGCGGTSAQPTAAPAQATQAPVVEPTATAVPATSTPVPPTNTPVPATDTPASPTDTPVPPTDTPVPPTATVAATEAPTEEAVEPTEEASSGIPMVPHSVVGIEDQCLTCHGPAGVKPVPADHEGRTVDTCLTCHQLDDSGGSAAPGIPHSIVGMETQCLTCHGEGGVKPFPADHTDRPVDTCTTCHTPQS